MMQLRKKSPWIRLSKLILAGAAAIGPMVGSIWLLYIIYKLLLKMGNSMVNFMWRFVLHLGDHPSEPPQFPGVGFLHFLLPLLILLGAGVFLANPIGKKMLRAVEAVVTRLPFVGFIYKSLGQLVGAIKGLEGERKFKSVVFVEYPSPGCRMIGFVTGEFQEHPECEGLTSVFVPTSPNPLTGFLVLIENDKIQPSNMTVEEASKMVLSAGLVTPGKVRSEK
ncbi:MAG: putative membrane protein [Crocinitomicaceae bacterium]|jgi:uncharacterized membrane protein